MPQASGISAEDAKAIALKDAGVSEEEVQIIKTDKEFSNGIECYEIEFIAGETEYSYNITVSDGSVIEREAESIYD